MKRYVFFICNNDGAEFRWRNLTERQASSMHKWTEKHIDWLNVKSFGWEEREMKDLLTAALIGLCFYVFVVVVFSVQ